MTNKNSGFIVHPFESFDGKSYDASYGNHNKTNRSFKTLSQAKNYLRKKGIQKADYDSPSGVKIILLKERIKRKIKSKLKQNPRNPIEEMIKKETQII